MSIQALRERVATRAKEVRDLVENNNEKWNSDLQSKYDAGMSEIEDVKAQIDRLQKADELLKNTPDAVHARAMEVATRTPGAHGENNAAIKAYLSNGIKGLSDEQARAHASRVNPDIRAAMSTSTNSEGGFTVAAEYMRTLEAAQKAYGGMLQVATTLETASGATMNFPTGDATGEVGEIVGQNATVTRLDTTFANLSLDVYKYSSKDIAIPWELVQDSFLDIEAYIQEVLATRLGRILNTHCTTGTGTGQPRGIVTAAALGKTGTTGQTATVTYDDLVDLEHSVDPAYRAMPGVGFMMNDQSIKVIRKLKDAQNRPIFVPGYETGVPGGSPDTLLGRPIIVNQDVATMAANAKSILFGAFSKYKIRRVMDLTMFRMTDSAFTRNGQIGFVAFNRMGGNLIDVSGSTVKYYANSAT
jgi:HK97 family phage major capsid protein